MAIAVLAVVARAGEWSPAVEVRHDDEVAVSYQARVDGQYLVVRATLAPGWHTFAMDNKKRADEKLAGKPALSVDRPTEIAPSGGLEIAGPWYQTPPKDFSRPELRWFSWGFERQAVFVAKIGRSTTAAARLALRGQACTETICKNIDVAIPLSPSNVKTGTSSEINVRELVAVR
jgi:DsbC/DsbD-like thiol-disulfide interchange protein